MRQGQKGKGEAPAGPFVAFHPQLSPKPYETPETRVTRLREWEWTGPGPQGQRG